MTNNKPDKARKELIEVMAEGLIHLAPLPDITPLQKIVNRLYLKCRISGMPSKEASAAINGLLASHNITKKDLLKTN